MTRELVAIGEATGEPPASLPAPLATCGVTAAAAPAAAGAAITGAAVSAIVPSTLAPQSSSTASVAALMFTISVTKGADPTSRQAPGALSAVSNLAASLLREPALTLIAGAANAHATPAIDLNDVRTTVGGSDAVMVKLLTNFNGRARATINSMRRAVEVSDWTTLKRDSHSLKGSSGYLAAMALKAAAIALERSADESLQGPPVGTSPAEALVHVEEEMTRVLLAIGEATGEPPTWRASRPWSYAD